MRKIPGGISKKTGKSYDEFYACSNAGCSYTWNPPKGTTAKPGEISTGEKVDYIYKWVKKQSMDDKKIRETMDGVEFKDDEDDVVVDGF